MFIPNSMVDLDKIVMVNKDKLLLLYFGASWCGPCKFLKKNLTDDKLMSNYSKMISVYIDVDNDNFSDLCKTYNIASLPTQIITILKNDQLLNIHKLEGFNWEKLISMYEDSLKYLKDDSSDDKSSESNSKSNDKTSNSNSKDSTEDESSSDSDKKS
jgi:thiol-disulfide isomerase/thioredoxin